MTIIGFGFGYHLESMLELFSKAVHVIEPNKEVLKAALSARDLTQLLSKISGVYLENFSSQDTFTRETELFVRPQSLIVDEAKLPGIKQRFYGSRGLKALHPTIASVGPIQGGTQPIMQYTTRALNALNQRVREIDMTGFNGGFETLDTLIKDPARRQSIHNSER